MEAARLLSHCKEVRVFSSLPQRLAGRCRIGHRGAHIFLLIICCLSSTHIWSGTAFLFFVGFDFQDDVVLVLISGGGSALLALPAESLTVEDLSTATVALSQAGADITVRGLGARG